jgi:D-alanyl-D-alanine carboxypeptidase
MRTAPIAFAILLFAAAVSAQQPRIVHATLTTIAASSDLGAQIRNSKTAFIGYSVPETEGERVMCCFNIWGDYRTGGTCSLDRESGSFNSGDQDDLHVVTTVMAQSTASRRQAQRAETLRALVEQFRSESHFPGAVAGAWFADNSSVVVAVGVADRELRIPMTNRALLHAGSVGKTFFAALILQLVGEGRIGLDDKVEKYLGGESWYAGIPNAKTITVRMLLNHTSGVPEYGSDFMESLIKEPGRARSPLEAVKSVAGAKPSVPAGDAYRYSDVNYQLLQLIAERVTGRPASVEIRRRLLKPHGLSRVVPADRKRIPGLVQGYAGKGNFMGFDAVMANGKLILDPTFEGGGGGFVTNAGDLAKWMALFAEGKVFPASLLPDVRRGVPAGQLDAGKDALSGLGVEIVGTPLGVAYGHGGFFPGYVSLVLWYPNVGISLALQVNSSAGNAFARPLREVLNAAARVLADE